jgi:hypothetical protein
MAAYVEFLKDRKTNPEPSFADMPLEEADLYGGVNVNGKRCDP